MTRIKLLISYDGTIYCGWQKQKKASGEKPSIQETLELALSKLFNEPIKATASGRTDAGVHAVGQVVHFDTSKKIDRWNIPWAIRSILPQDIVVKKAWVAPEEFHSLFSAKAKTYKFWVYNHPVQTALLARYTHWVRQPLSIEDLNQLCVPLLGEQDFKSFQSVGTEVATTVRKIYAAEWRRKNSKLLEFQVTGSGFLKQMVRNIVGAQLNFSLKKKSPETFKALIDAKDRSHSIPSVAPQGLYLFKVFYPNKLDNQCRQL